MHWTGLIWIAVMGTPPQAAPSQPTAAILYADCRRVMQERRGNEDIPVSVGDRSSCGSVALKALMGHARFIGNPEYPEQDLPRFCLPAGFPVSIEQVWPLVEPFLLYFEAHQATVAGKPSLEIFLNAMRDKWPCRTSPTIRFIFPLRWGHLIALGAERRKIVPACRDEDATPGPNVPGATGSRDALGRYRLSDAA